MPAPPRLAFPGTAVLITTRTEEGLPFTAAEYMNLSVWSFLAKAQNLFPIKICHMVSMSNHPHLVAYVENPEDVSAFMNLYKTDTAHVFNRLRGRKKRTVWCKSFDCVPILTVEDVIEQIAYLYVNPQKANLERTIELYPGVSTWEMYQKGITEKDLPVLWRTFYHKLESGYLTRKGQQALARELEEQATERQLFKLSPDAWMDAFGITDEEEKKAINRRIVARVRELEAEYDQKRIKDGTPVLGRDQIIDQPIDKPYIPKKFSKRQWCICRDIPKRVAYIYFVKRLIIAGKAVWQRWKVGDYSVPYPLGLFAPRLRRRGNLLPGHLY